MMRWVLQAATVTRVSLGTLLERKGSSVSAIFGVAGVVAVLVGVLSIGQGFKTVLATTGSPSTAIVLRGGTDSEMSSILSREEVDIIAQTDGVREGPDGPLASAELFVIVDLPKRSTGSVANVPLRGVQAPAFRIRENFELLEGRIFEPGRNEIIVGEGAAREFAGLAVGSTQRWGQNEWKVVGRFTTGGSVEDSEIWCDARVLQPAYRRGSSFQSVHVKLDSPEAFERFKEALTVDPRLQIQVQREPDYYAEQSTVLVTLVNALGRLVAGLMGIGAVFGALNTMYTTVASRSREIATLRALGFGGGSVVLSVMVEALLLTLTGGMIGGGAAYLIFDGYRSATMNWQSFSQVAFAFDVTPELLFEGILYACLVGLVGGLFPALRAARLPVASALREL